MTSAGFEPAVFRFVAQHLNHCATAVPDIVDVPSLNLVLIKIFMPIVIFVHSLAFFYVNTCLKDIPYFI